MPNTGHPPDPAEHLERLSHAERNGVRPGAGPAGGRRSAVDRAHRDVDTELRRGEIGPMLRAWHAACASALGGGTWDAMVAIGNTALRIGQSTGFKVAFAAKAGRRITWRFSGRTIRPR